MVGSQGAERRELILTRLSKSWHISKIQMQSGETRSRPVQEPSEQFQLVFTHCLVEGEKIGHAYNGGYCDNYNSRFVLGFNCF
jgi:hypothetical protein